MNKGTFGLTLEQLAAILNQQQMHSLTLPDSPTLSPGETNVVVPVEPLNQSKLSKPSNRCFHGDCKKKLLLSDPVCKCNERFCSSHRMPELHVCSFDYKAAGKTQLEKANPKVDGFKMEKL